MSSTQKVMYRGWKQQWTSCWRLQKSVTIWELQLGLFGWCFSCLVLWRNLMCLVLLNLWYLWTETWSFWLCPGSCWCYGHVTVPQIYNRFVRFDLFSLLNCYFVIVYHYWFSFVIQVMLGPQTMVVQKRRKNFIGWSSMLYRSWKIRMMFYIL